MRKEYTNKQIYSALYTFAALTAIFLLELSQQLDFSMAHLLGKFFDARKLGGGIPTQDRTLRRTAVQEKKAGQEQKKREGTLHRKTASPPSPTTARASSSSTSKTSLAVCSRKRRAKLCRESSPNPCFLSVPHREKAMRDAVKRKRTIFFTVHLRLRIFAGKSVLSRKKYIDFSVRIFYNFFVRVIYPKPNKVR